MKIVYETILRTVFNTFQLIFAYYAQGGAETRRRVSFRMAATPFLTVFAASESSAGI
jgi:hypothetical protein